MVENKIIPEERIKLIKRIKELEEKKIKEIEKKKKKELADLKEKSKKLENELSEELKDSIEELARIESEKRQSEIKRQNFEEQIIKQSANPQSFNYNNLINNIKSENPKDLKEAYNEVKEIARNIEYSDSDISSSFQQVKTIVDKMNEQNDLESFGYIKRMQYVINQAMGKEDNKRYDY